MEGNTNTDWTVVQGCGIRTDKDGISYLFRVMGERVRGTFESGRTTREEKKDETYTRTKDLDTTGTTLTLLLRCFSTNNLVLCVQSLVEGSPKRNYILLLGIRNSVIINLKDNERRFT